MSKFRTLTPAEYAADLAPLRYAGYAVLRVKANENECRVQVRGPLGILPWRTYAPNGFGVQSPIGATADALIANLLPRPSALVLAYYAEQHELN